MDNQSDTALRLLDRAWKARASVVEDVTGPDSKKSAIQDSILSDLSEAVSIFRKISAKKELVHALRRLGHVEQDLGMNDSTRDRYSEAVSICRNLDDPMLLAHSLRHLGDHYMEVHEMAKAEPFYSEALSLYRNEETPPIGDFANALRRIAILKEAQGKRVEALAAWTETLDLYSTIRLIQGVEECRMRISTLTELNE